MMGRSSLAISVCERPSWLRWPAWLKMSWDTSARLMADNIEP